MANEVLLDKEKMFAEAKEILANSKDYDKAANIVAKLLNEEPNNYDYLYIYAECLGHLDDESDLLEAVDIYKKISKDLKRNYNFQIGFIYKKLGLYKKAIKRFEYDKQKNNFSKVELAKIYGYNLRKYDEAINLLEELEKDGFEYVSLSIQKNIYCKIGKTNFIKEKLLALLNEENNEWINELLIDVYFREKNYKEAKKCFDNVKNFKSKFESYYTMGEIYFYEKNYEDAIKFYQESLKKAPKGKIAFIYCRIGNCYFKLSDLENAKKYYLKANNLQSSKHSLLNLGKIEYLYHQKVNENKNNLDHLYDARKYLLLGFHEYPDDLFIKYELAKVEVEFGNYNFAMRHLDDILKINNDRYALIEKAKIYQLEKKFGYAIDIYEKLIKEEEDKYIMLDLGKCYAMIGKKEPALKYFDRILELTDGKDECAKIEKARLLRKTGSPEEAEEIIDTADKENNFEFYIVEQANLYYEQGKHNEAVNLLLDSIKKKPNNYRIYYALAKIQKKLGKLEDAIESINKAISINKLNSNVYFLGNCYYELGNYDEAIKVYSRIKESGDYYAESNLAIAKAYLMKGEYENAYNIVYPLADTKIKKDAYAILIMIEKLFGHNDVIESYMNRFDENGKQIIKRIIEKTEEQRKK